jgi:hypothetical protein
MNGSLFYFVRLFLFAFIFYLEAIAYSSPSCRAIFEQQSTNIYSQFLIADTWVDGLLVGRTVNFVGSESYGSPKVVTINEPNISIRSNRFDLAELGTVGKVYTYTVGGEMLLAAEAARLEHIATLNSHNGAIVSYSSEALAPIAEVMRQQRAIHEKVIESYRSRKASYLHEGDLHELNAIAEEFSDVLVFSIHPKVISEKGIEALPTQEITNSLLGTISVVFGSNSKQKMAYKASAVRNYYLPLFRRLEAFSISEAIAKLRRQIKNAEDRINNSAQTNIEENLINIEIINYFNSLIKVLVQSLNKSYTSATPFVNSMAEMGKVFEAKFGSASTFAEFTRFWRAALLPKQQLDFLVLQALQTAESQGVKYIIASADMATSRLFKQKYKFVELAMMMTKKFQPNESEESVQPEFVLYLEVGSEPYKELIQTLKKSSENVIIN